MDAELSPRIGIGQGYTPPAVLTGLRPRGSPPSAVAVGFCSVVGGKGIRPRGGGYHMEKHGEPLETNQPQQEETMERHGNYAMRGMAHILNVIAWKVLVNRLWICLANVQASSIKHRAANIKHYARRASSIEHRYEMARDIFWHLGNNI